MTRTAPLVKTLYLTGFHVNLKFYFGIISKFIDFDRNIVVPALVVDLQYEPERCQIESGAS